MIEINQGPTQINRERKEFDKKNNTMTVSKKNENTIEKGLTV